MPFKRQWLIDALGVPASKGSVVSLVIEGLREALLRKELRPGDHPPSESELTKSLGISKSSVREAIKILQAMSVVKVRREKGTTILKKPGEVYIRPMDIRGILLTSD